MQMQQQPGSITWRGDACGKQQKSKTKIQKEKNDKKNGEQKKKKSVFEQVTSVACKRDATRL